MEFDTCLQVLQTVIYYSTRIQEDDIDLDRNGR